MANNQPKPKRHIPERTCVACRVKRPKRELLRIVRTPAGTIAVDENGKLNGRGAYLCRQRACWERALARHILDRALRCTLARTGLDTLHSYLVNLP